MIEGHLRRAAGERQHARGQQLEGQHLRVTARSRAAGAAHVHLRDVRSVLRHEQDLLRRIAQRADLLQHPRGLARAGAAQQDTQHDTVPPFRRFFLFYHHSRRSATVDIPPCSELNGRQYFS